MENEIAGKILKRVGNKDLLDILTKKLSFSELNSLLLEVYKMRSEDLAPDELLNMYISNRFVKPALEDAIELLQLELDILKISSALSFIPIELSPVAPLGACSAVATANQNKIISALRGTEVLADATNSLALHICHMKREMKVNDGAGGTVDRMRYCTVHRHVRAQKFNNPRSFPHFKLFCMVTSGRDSGSYLFEKGSLLEYFNLYKTVFSQLAGIDNLKYKIF